MAVPVDIAKDKYKKHVGDQSIYEKGIDNVKESPMKKAVAKKDLFEKKTIESKPKLIKGLQNTSRKKWEDSTIKGFDKLETKVKQAVDSGEYPAEHIIKAGLAGHEAAEKLPEGTLSQSYDRMMANRTAIEKYWASK